jgi:hypothetical protein
MRRNCATICSPLRRSNAAWPVSAQNRVAPSPYTSEDSLGGSPLRTSGAVNAGEPVKVPVAVLNPPEMWAIPKSLNAGSPYSVSKMFAGLTSRCTIPRRCAVSSAPAIFTPSRSTIQRKRTESADPRLQRALPVVLHHQIRVTALGFADLQHAHDVRMAGEPTHCSLLAQEPLPVLVKFGGEDLHRHYAVQGDLRAPIDNAEAAATDLFGVAESGSVQFRDDGRADFALGPERVAVHHRFPARWLSIAPEQTTERLSTAPSRGLHRRHVIDHASASSALLDDRGYTCVVDLG